MNLAKRIIKNTFRRFNLEIDRFNPSTSPTAQIVSSFCNFEIDMVFDVGANQGQFASDIRSGGYEGNILSFEPLSKAHNLLLKACDKDEKWDAYRRCALGAEVGELEINIAGNSASSSLLPMLDSHLSAAPYSAYIGKESAPLLTLDSIVQGNISNFKNPFLKIDTQGFEWEVLNGAKNILPSMRGVLVELSVVPLYEGQHLWQEMISRLEQEGFVLWALQQGFTDPRNGRSLQLDGLFFRN